MRIIDADVILACMKQSGLNQITITRDSLEELNPNYVIQRKGKWVLGEDMKLKCSFCNEEYHFDDKDECLDFMEYAKYCLSCGAKMGKESEDAE